MEAGEHAGAAGGFPPRPPAAPSVPDAPASADGARVLASDVRLHFEGVKALDGVTLWLDVGEILGLIGPNGAGKTSLVNVLSGFVRPTSGSIAIGGRDVTGKSAPQLALDGLVRTFQAVRLFPGLTVLENVELGAIGVGRSQRQARTTAWALLQRMSLADKANHRADALPHGEERLVGVARALAAGPRFLLLDEPGAGLDDEESDQLVRTLTAIRDDYELGMLVIEHDMHVIMGLCDRVHVLDHGQTIAIGTPEQVRRDENVLTAYLGTAH